MSLGLEVGMLLALCVANGAFAAAEIALLSVRKARLEDQARRGDARAAVALELANAPNDMLSTVQVGITLIGVLTGVFGGATLGDRLGGWLAGLPLIGAFGQALGFGTVVVGVTFVSLVVGELAPKQIALANAETIARLSARPMRWLSRAASPAVRILGWATELLLRLVPLGRRADPTITDNEVKVLLREGTAMGAFREEERVMIENVLRLGDRRASAVMTPRTRMVTIDVDAGPADIASLVEAHRHSRYPVIEGHADNVLGVVTTRELLAHALRGHPLDLRSILHPAMFIPEQLAAIKVVDAFRSQRPHLAMVIDEHGGVAGLVTAGDLLEAVVGDMPSSRPEEEQEAVRRADGSWLLDGGLPVDQVQAILGVADDAEPGPLPYETLAGLVLARLGRIPKIADAVEWQGWRIEVVDMDGRRTDRLLASRLPPPAAEADRAGGPSD